jgi:hypothetical protein
MISAQIKRLHSPDIPDLAAYEPADGRNFGFLLQIIAGPSGEDGEESFDVTVCTPSWLAENLGPTGILIGRHHLIVARYNYQDLKRFLVDFSEKHRANSWAEIAEQLGRIGKWEFEDYRP